MCSMGMVEAATATSDDEVYGDQMDNSSEVSLGDVSDVSDLSDGGRNRPIKGPS